MFEVTGNDIAVLGDSDLRTLIARLAIAELSSEGLPISAVTAGGSQDTADGGIDVRVTANGIKQGNFIPRKSTGYQVKKSDMTPAEILAEMRPKNKLRDAIVNLVAEEGAYVIVSAQGSVADKPLLARKKAMRDALGALPGQGKIFLDFYDRDRLAVWVNLYPAIVTWVRERSDRRVSGWSSIGDWADTKVGEDDSYLSEISASLLDEHKSEPEKLTLLEGIARLRGLLKVGGKCVRLIGLSGLGKTRLVRALFETDIGEAALDPGLAIYADYGEKTEPTAREMARQLRQIGNRAILIVDNCNPSTHSVLAGICSAQGSSVSLLTVEYDVGGDEPEDTQVFRMEAVSDELLLSWISKEYPHISQVDCNRIAKFSQGNFRIARALAGSVAKGETLGLLKDKNLLERIFQQRNVPDPQLLKSAERLSLFYSFDGTDTKLGSELALLGQLRGRSASEMFEAVAILRDRKIIQSRGKWRAVLPQAIANSLASSALEQISPADFDEFCRALPPRMLKSLSRRLGYLHQSPEAKALVVRWLESDGPLGDFFAPETDGITLVVNLAPVAPEVALNRIRRELGGENRNLIISENCGKKTELIGLSGKLAYDASMFERAVDILELFLNHQDSDNQLDDGSQSFANFFHIVLSGTKATPQQRQLYVRKLLGSGNESRIKSGIVALKGLLKTSYFSTFQSFEFGARLRDWGWQPANGGAIDDWFNGAMQIVIDFQSQIPSVTSVLADSVRNLWHRPGCRKSIESAVSAISGERTWIEGWLSLRATLNYDGNKMSNEDRERLMALVEKYKPRNLLDEARAIVSQSNSGEWEYADGVEEKIDWRRAREKVVARARLIGQSLAEDNLVRHQFLREIWCIKYSDNIFVCGCGLAAGTRDLSIMWKEIAASYDSADVSARYNFLLRGFIAEAFKRDRETTEGLLDSAMNDPRLVQEVATLQSIVGVDQRGLTRLRQGLIERSLKVSSLYSIANGSVEKSPSKELARLLNELTKLPEGMGVAIEILSMRFYCDRSAHRKPTKCLVDCGRKILRKLNFSQTGIYRDYSLRKILKQCVTGGQGRSTAKICCKRIREAVGAYVLSVHEMSETISALFELQPEIALSEFLLPVRTGASIGTLYFDEFRSDSPVERIDPNVIIFWADQEKDIRYSLLGEFLSLFKSRHDEGAGELSSLFLLLLEHAPDKYGFLGGFSGRVHPRSWGGSLADAFMSRRLLLTPLETHPDSEVRRWVAELDSNLNIWIEDAKKRDRNREESFE